MAEFLCALLIPLCWAWSPGRLQASLLIFGSYLAAAHELPLAFTRVLPEQGRATGVILWGLQAFLLTLPWALTWQPGKAAPAKRAGAFLGAWLLEVCPPFGLIGWLHPFTLGGWLYPGWAGAGLVATFGLLTALALRSVPLLLPLGAAALVANLLAQPAPLPSGWTAIDTHLPRAGAEPEQRLERQTRLMALVEQAWPAGPAVLLMPEEIAGPWTEAEAFWWAPLLRRARSAIVTLVLGAQQPLADGWRNGALLLEPGQTRWQFARQPIPYAEWRPWDTSSARAGWLPGDRWGTTQVAGKQVLFSFCFEDLLTLPILVTLWQAPSPEVLVSLANLWWTGGMREPQVQRLTVESWGRLWGIPVVRAVNLP